ncbi:MAG TPA: hypothetical protein DCL48_02710, partial [Alphaproteobacteria bacterium]|nr:hypothetical protein [Alphaproteobacteria bacterium]
MGVAGAVTALAAAPAFLGFDGLTLNADGARSSALNSQQYWPLGAHLLLTASALIAGLLLQGLLQQRRGVLPFLFYVVVTFGLLGTA